MADVSITFNDKKAKKFFQQIINQTKKASDMDKVFIFSVVAKNVIADYTDHFENQQGGPSNLWSEWSDSYLNHLRKIGRQGNNILSFNGRLRRSFHPQNYRIETAGIRFFNNAKTASGFPYAAAHNEGGPKLPKRRFMWLSGKAMNKIGRETLKFITGGK